MRKNNVKKIFAALLALGLISTFTACQNSSKHTESYSEFKWPDSEIASLIPTPKSSIGKIEDDSYNYLRVYVSNTTKEQFNDYIDECKKKGFTVDYSKSDDSYSAKNKDGYDLDIQYEDNNVMEIVLDDPDEESSTESTTSKTESSKSEQSSASEVESSIASKSESSEAKTENSKSEQSKSENDIDPKFKEAMDSYEKFIDEYVEFMKKYNESDNAISMLSEYTDYLKQYTETMEKLDDMDDDELTNAELAYYTETMLRINKKLTEVAQEMS